VTQTNPLLSLIVVLAFVAAGAILSFRPVYEPDLGWHLAQGRENLSGHLVRTNVFSFLYPDYRQHYTPWLSDTIAYTAWKVGGDAGVQAVYALILSATLGLVYLACRVRAAVVPTVAVLAIGFLVIEPRAIPRPHLVSFASMALCGWLIERASAKRSAGPLLWAIPIVALWSNAHVECVFGVLAILTFAVAELVRPSALPRGQSIRALGIAVLCAAALLANPYGWGLLQYLIENVSVPQILGIAELQPAYLPTYRAFFAYLIVVCGLLLFFPRQIRLWEVLATIVFGALGVRYLRLTPLVFLVTAPMVAARLTALTARSIDARAMLVTALAAAIFLSRLPVSAFVTELRVGSLHPESMFSSRAVRFAQAEGLNGAMFNSNNLGGWLAWTLYPQAKVFQDSRLQAYPPDHFRRILEASRSQAAWDELVRGVDWAMLSIPRQNVLSGIGRFPRADWATVFWDEAVEIVVRRTGRYENLARSHEYQVLTPEADLFGLAPMLTSVDRDRIRTEARRNRSENPEGFTAAAVLCLMDDPSACADVERLGARWPAHADDLALVRVLRSKQ
jgi:hypothetical protein